jgi:YesN/AraC family two-component response regulator
MTAPSRILIVDDDLPFLEVLHDALAPRYDVLTTPSGAAALDLIAQHPPDLVLLDYALPDIPGLAVLRTIKKRFPSVIVILITGFGSEHVSVEAFRAGAREYLKKPFPLDDLLARVEGLLALREHPSEARTPILLHPSPAGAEPARRPRAAGLQRAIALIDAGLDTTLTLDQVAREAGMSRCHFCRAFKASTGLTFREFLTRRRVTRASELLLDASRTVTDVCFEVGFNDATHFGRVFRKLTGHPPSLYRHPPAPPASSVPTAEPTGPPNL